MARPGVSGDGRGSVPYVADECVASRQVIHRPKPPRQLEAALAATVPAADRGQPLLMQRLTNVLVRTPRRRGRQSSVRGEGPRPRRCMPTRAVSERSAVTPFSTPPQMPTRPPGYAGRGRITAAGTAQSTLTEMITATQRAAKLTSPLLQSSNGPLSGCGRPVRHAQFPPHFRHSLTDLQPYASFSSIHRGPAVGMGNNFIQSAKTSIDRLGVPAASRLLWGCRQGRLDGRMLRRAGGGGSGQCGFGWQAVGAAGGVTAARPDLPPATGGAWSVPPRRRPEACWALPLAGVAMAQLMPWDSSPPSWLAHPSPMPVAAATYNAPASAGVVRCGWQLVGAIFGKLLRWGFSPKLPSTEF